MFLKFCVATHQIRFAPKIIGSIFAINNMLIIDWIILAFFYNEQNIFNCSISLYSFYTINS